MKANLAVALFDFPELKQCCLIGADQYKFPLFHISYAPLKVTLSFGFRKFLNSISEHGSRHFFVIYF